MSESKLLPQVAVVLHEVNVAFEVLDCDPALADTASFCEHYGFSLGQSANTIIVASRKVEPTKYAVCVVLATTKLDVNKKVCQLMGVKKASFADGETTAQLTGMEIGGVTAIGTKGMPIYVDDAVLEQTQVVMGGGNRTSKLILNPTELQKIDGVTIIDGLATPKTDL